MTVSPRVSGGGAGSAGTEEEEEGRDGKAVLQPPRGRAPRCVPGAGSGPPSAASVAGFYTPGWAEAAPARPGPGAAQAVAVPGEERERGC